MRKGVELNVDYDSNFQVEKIYGYAPRESARGFSMALENLNNGVTQVILTKFRVKDMSKISRPVKVRLSYFDVKRQKIIEEVQEINLNDVEK